MKKVSKSLITGLIGLGLVSGFSGCDVEDTLGMKLEDKDELIIVSYLSGYSTETYCNENQITGTQYKNIFIKTKLEKKTCKDYNRESGQSCQEINYGIMGGNTNEYCVIGYDLK